MKRYNDKSDNKSKVILKEIKKEKGKIIYLLGDYK